MGVEMELLSDAEGIPSEPIEPYLLLERAGPILFGEFWRAPFCAMFEINERVLRRMLAGTADVPAGLLHDIELALRDHGTALDNLLAEWP